ncbi:tetra-peptide repeat homeobox protein 1-like [Nylanderia fulva]|uniref:tetra-peptide repeat homeobox protein 1-like n=1 Tax=Nylanderia fulva TaxID=613905 RepID=UPI0010FB54F6|nr:tetra-peptide repeat homeobox protein 1-like [Nylanderia fulva]
MSWIPLFLTLICTYALASVPKDAKQQKRGIIGNNGWIGLSSPYGYGHGHPWTSVDHIPWKGLKLPEVNLHAGLHLAGALPAYGLNDIALTSGILKTLPVYITKHVVLEKPVPVPEPVIIEKPYHVPIPIEKIIHKPIPVPVPVPQAVPVPVERPVPIPVKEPIAVPVHQPYPVPVKHPVAVPVPVPVPVPIHSVPPSLPLIPTGGLPGAIYLRDYAPAHLHPILHSPSSALHLDHGGALAHLPHGFDHGLGHVALPHGYEYDAHAHVHADHLVHGHDHKKRKTDKN